MTISLERWLLLLRLLLSFLFFLFFFFFFFFGCGTITWIGRGRILGLYLPFSNTRGEALRLPLQF